jgi:hypothetical protein
LQPPAWMLLDDTLYFFDKEIEGKKLQPFLNKRFIAIPRSSEQSYFEKFVAPLIEKHNVYAEGFTINTEKYDARPVLKPIYVEGGTSQLQLYFKYAGYIFHMAMAAQYLSGWRKMATITCFTALNARVPGKKAKWHNWSNWALKRYPACSKTWKLIISTMRMPTIPFRYLNGLTSITIN